LELHFNDARFHVCTEQNKVATVSLNAWPHELNERQELSEALTALLVGERCIRALFSGHRGSPQSVLFHCAA
jgi:hypothetical protein